MNVEIETEAPQFLSREYLFQIFGIMSLESIASNAQYSTRSDMFLYLFTYK